MAADSRYAELRQEYASILRLCCRSRSLGEGRKIHGRMIHSGHTRDRYLGNLLVQMYRDCGSLDAARAVFDGMPLKNEFSWAIIISGYVNAGRDREALHLYDNLVSSSPSTDILSDGFVLSSILAACGRLKRLDLGEKIDDTIARQGVKEDVKLQNSLLTMYSRCGRVDRAREIFDRIGRKDVVSWNAIIAANASSGHLEEAVKCYHEMVSNGLEPDAFTYASVIDALAGLDRIEEAVLLHSKLRLEFQSDTIVGTSLIGLYSKCREIENARMVFAGISRRDVLCWNTMLAAEAMTGNDRQALELYRRMLGENRARPNEATLVTLLAACTRLGDLYAAAAARIDAARLGLDRTATVGTAVVNFYSSCGELDTAREAFDRVADKDTVSWTAMVAGYARHGHGSQAVETFQELCLDGVSLDAVAFTNILGACSHSGLLDELCRCFGAMRSEHGIDPEAEHYRCLITGLGRSGRISEAEVVIKSMEFVDATAWMALLHSCRTHECREVGAAAGNEVIQASGKDNSAVYVALSNLYRSPYDRCV